MLLNTNIKKKPDVHILRIPHLSNVIQADVDCVPFELMGKAVGCWEGLWVGVGAGGTLATGQEKLGEAD